MSDGGNGPRGERLRRAEDEEFARAIAEKEELRMRRKGERDRTLLAGIGVSGAVGWSVAAPALLGVALGIWIDRRWPGQRSWTLMLLVGGILLGSLNAWRWVTRAGNRMKNGGRREP